jgi:hypothetical protein
MKKFLILGALTAATLATPALAQDYRGYDRDHGYDRGYESGARYSAAIRTNRELIEDAMRTGRVARWEARPILEAQRNLEAWFNRYRYNGLNGWERRNLEERIARIRLRIDRSLQSGDRNGHRRWR